MFLVNLVPPRCALSSQLLFLRVYVGEKCFVLCRPSMKCNKPYFNNNVIVSSSGNVSVSETIQKMAVFRRCSVLQLLLVVFVKALGKLD